MKRAVSVSLLILFLVVNVFVLPMTTNAPEAHEARITEVEGTVEVQKTNSTEWEKVTTTPYLVYEGDKIRTGENSEAEARFGDTKKSKIKENTQVELAREELKWVIMAYKGFIIVVCLTGMWVPLLRWFCIGHAIGWWVGEWYFMSNCTMSCFNDVITLESGTETCNVTGSIGLYPNGTAWATGQQVTVYDNGTISEPIEVSLNPEQASELHEFAFGEAVGGMWIPVDKLSLLAPYIALATTILVATAATAIYVKRIKKKQ